MIFIIYTFGVYLLVIKEKGWNPSLLTKVTNLEIIKGMMCSSLSSPRLHLCSLQLAKIWWNHSFLHITRATMKAGRRKNDDTPRWLSENEVNTSKLTLFQYINGNITLAAFFIACLKKTLTIHYSCIKEKPRAFPETIRCLPLKGLCHLLLANELNMLLRTFHGLLALWKVDYN